MAEKKKILYVVEAMGGGVFTYIVELANALSDEYEVYIAYAISESSFFVSAASFVSLITPCEVFFCVVC